MNDHKNSIWPNFETQLKKKRLTGKYTALDYLSENKKKWNKHAKDSAEEVGKEQ